MTTQPARQSRKGRPWVALEGVLGGFRPEAAGDTLFFKFRVYDFKTGENPSTVCFP